jgi:hypothetical protein
MSISLKFKLSIEKSNHWANNPFLKRELVIDSLGGGFKEGNLIKTPLKLFRWYAGIIHSRSTSYILHKSKNKVDLASRGTLCMWLSKRISIDRVDSTRCIEGWVKDGCKAEVGSDYVDVFELIVYNIELWLHKMCKIG